MKDERTLVILAAGIGSRFRAGIKQLQSVGPNGEMIMDYSIHDALEAGFNRFIFIIRHDLQALFDASIGERVRRRCDPLGIEVLCAYQEKENLPGGYRCPADRAKPWGTGQALLACKGILRGKFAVINADDFYGKDAYRQAMAFLDALPDNSAGLYGVVGFRLDNTLSEYGGVTRGLCRTDPEGWLCSIRETKKIMMSPLGPGVFEGEGWIPLPGETPVSMNMWGFTADVLERLEEQFIDFLGENLNEPKSEFLIPTQVGVMLDRGEAKVRVIPTQSVWFGMTYAEDVPDARSTIARMTTEGIYPKQLDI